MPRGAIKPLLMWIDSSMHKHTRLHVLKDLNKNYFHYYYYYYILASTWTAAFLAVGLTLLMNTLKMK